jgi:hypothetical protein
MSVILLQSGPIRLAFLDSYGGKVKTLVLPAPDRGMPALEWARKSTTVTLVGGGERTRVDGYLPILTLKYKVYDERPGQGYTIGTADGQRPQFVDLLWYLSQPTGRLRVAPGLTAGGFTVDAVTVKPITIRAGLVTEVDIVFRAREVQPTMTLEVF